MQFIYHPEPQNEIILSGESHKYLFKIRRMSKKDTVKIRNLKDDFLYIYSIKEIGKKQAVLSLKEKKFLPKKPRKFLHLAWCVIDPKNIEKTLPSLNEIGAGKISFVYCDYSQRNFKLKHERIIKILISSCQQCGRSDLMQIEYINSSKEFFNLYPDFYALDFHGEFLENKINPDKPFFIGPEGGFSENERNCFQKTYKLKSFILRSETALCALSAKILT